MDGEPSLWDYLGFFATAGLFFLSIFYIEAIAKKLLERWRLYRKKN
jgi:hypothetical protein